MQTKVVQNQKTTKRLSIFIIGCMSHPEKATSTCYLGNYLFLRPDYEDKSCLESKNSGEKYLPQRMYESSRNSYTIRPSRKKKIFDT